MLTARTCFLALLLTEMSVCHFAAATLAAATAAWDVRMRLSTKTPYAWRVPTPRAPSLYSLPDPPDHAPVFMYVLARHGELRATAAGAAADSICVVQCQHGGGSPLQRCCSGGAELAAVTTVCKSKQVPVQGIGIAMPPVVSSCQAAAPSTSAQSMHAALRFHYGTCACNLLVLVFQARAGQQQTAQHRCSGWSRCCRCEHASMHMGCHE